MRTGKKQMDIVMAVEKAEVSVVSAGPLVTAGQINAAIQQTSPHCWSITTR